MPNIEILFLLIFVGAACGSISSVIKVAPSLIALPALYFFLPVFDLSFNTLMLPIVATCITAFIPANLYAWILSMNKGCVDSKQLISFAPGIALGAVIGAQILSLVNINVFKIAFMLISFIAMINILYPFARHANDKLSKMKPWKLPIGLLTGLLSVLGGTCGRVLGSVLCHLSGTDDTQRQGTVNGIAVFASIAAMIGFIYPAKSFDTMGLTGFAGAVHLPSMVVLSVSHLFFYWLCRHRGNPLDKTVLKISFIIFMVFSLARLWLT